MMAGLAQHPFHEYHQLMLSALTCRYNDLTLAGADAASQLSSNSSAALAAANDPVTRRFSTAIASNLNTVRMFASQGNGGQNNALEPLPGT